MSQLKINDGNGNWTPIPAGGVGVPSGGNTGEVLTKSSASDYATEWAPFPVGSIVQATTYGGYVKFDNGLFIEWYSRSGITGQSHYYAFSVPFVSAPTVVATAGAGEARSWCSVEDSGLNGFTFWSDTSYGHWERWIAIGFWK